MMKKKTLLTIAEARERAKIVDVLILWRPDPTLPENEQYCWELA